MPLQRRVLKSSEADREKAGYYKGYDINWLRQETEHPEHHLVEEFDNKKAKAKLVRRKR